MWQFYSGARLLTPYEGHVIAEAAAALVEVPPAEPGEDRECDGVQVETYADRLRAKLTDESAIRTFFNWEYTQQVAGLEYMLTTMLAPRPLLPRTFDMDVCFLATAHTMGLKLYDYLKDAATGIENPRFITAYQRAYDHNRDQRLASLKLTHMWQTAKTELDIDGVVLRTVFTFVQYYCGNFAKDQEHAAKTGILQQSADYFVTPAPDCRDEDVGARFESIISHLLEVK